MLVSAGRFSLEERPALLGVLKVGRAFWVLGYMAPTSCQSPSGASFPPFTVPISSNPRPYSLQQLSIPRTKGPRSIKRSSGHCLAGACALDMMPCKPAVECGRSAVQGDSQGLWRCALPLFLEALGTGCPVGGMGAGEMALSPLSRDQAHRGIAWLLKEIRGLA